jgi:hypothetical protein
MVKEAICFCRELQYAGHNLTDFARLVFELAPQIAEARCLIATRVILFFRALGALLKHLTHWFTRLSVQLFLKQWFTVEQVPLTFLC